MELLFKYSFIILLLLGRPAYCSESETYPVSINSIKIEMVETCLNIVDGEPRNGDDQFLYGVDELYCYMKLSGIAQEVIYRHVWFHKGREYFTRQIKIRPLSTIYASRCSIPKDKFGQWEINIINEKGEVIKHLQFTVEEPAYKALERQMLKSGPERFFELFTGYNSNRDFPVHPLSDILTSRGIYQHNAMLSLYFHNNGFTKKYRSKKFELFLSFSHMTIWRVTEVDNRDEYPEFGSEGEYWIESGIVNTDKFGDMFTWKRDLFNIFGGVSYQWDFSSFMGMYFSGAIMGGDLFNETRLFYDADSGYYFNFGENVEIRINGMIPLYVLSCIMSYYAFYLIPFIYPPYIFGIRNIAASISIKLKRMKLVADAKGNTDWGGYVRVSLYAPITKRLASCISYMDSYDTAGLTTKFGLSLSYKF